MPPVMGAVAFIMAETLSVPYAEIVKAAVIPAMLYYFTAFWMVHLEAGRLKLLGLPKDQCPNPWHALKEHWYLAVPLAVLAKLWRKLLITIWLVPMKHIQSLKLMRIELVKLF